MSTEHEARANGRWNLSVPLPVYSSIEGAEKMGMAVNFSAEGLLVLGSDELPLKRPLTLWLELPHQTDRVRATTFSIWHERDEQGIFHTGFKVVAIAPKDYIQLLRLVDTDAS